MLLSQTLQPSNCNPFHLTTKESSVKKKQLHKTQKTEQILKIKVQPFLIINFHLILSARLFHLTNLSNEIIKITFIYNNDMPYIYKHLFFTFVYVRRHHTWKRWKQQLQNKMKNICQITMPKV